jgi:4-hydroxybenzoate polyprenyltransferase
MKIETRSQVIPSVTSAKATPIDRAKGLVRAIRPRQWTKNGAVFVGIIFAQKLFAPVALERTLLGFVIFCLVSSCVYLLNDLIDRQYDQEHPAKKMRPLASGLVPVSWAIIAIVFLLLICASLIFILFQLPIYPNSNLFSAFGGANVLFTLTICSYLGIMILYSLYLKHVALIDVFIIASGFVLRTFAGAIIIPVTISPWLYLVTCFLSLFLAFGKRRHELILLSEQAGQHRLALKEYSLALLDQLITIVVTGTVLSYSLYTIEGSEKDPRIALTIPIVLYGTFRYLYLTHMQNGGGSPEEILLRDPQIRICILLFILVAVVILYFLPA